MTLEQIRKEIKENMEEILKVNEFIQELGKQHLHPVTIHLVMLELINKENK